MCECFWLGRCIKVDRLARARQARHKPFLKFCPDLEVDSGEKWRPLILWAATQMKLTLRRFGFTQCETVAASCGACVDVSGAEPTRTLTNPLPPSCSIGTN